MPEIGEPFIRQISLEDGFYTEYFADAGEKWKVTMVYSSKEGDEYNKDVYVAPAGGYETSQIQGTNTGISDIPPVGSHAKGSTDVSQLQPIYISDTNGLHLGNDGNQTTNFLIQGVRVA